jgi:hypothetical protein
VPAAAGPRPDDRTDGGDRDLKKNKKLKVVITIASHDERGATRSVSRARR